MAPQRAWALAPAACALLVVATMAQQDAKSVVVSLRAKWKSTSLTLEAAEFLADERPDLFWKFIDSFTTDVVSVDDPNCKQALLNRVEQADLLSRQMTKMFDISLSMRKYSPKVEFLRTLAERAPPADGSCCWVQMGEETVVTAEQLKRALSANIVSNGTSPELFDHVHPAAMPGTPVAVLYGAPGVPCFAPFHQMLAAQSTVTYVL
eukprot:CAMPEP_0198221670 /NCGR_PEP_ID=MMETSP1445-20131203/84677_1 /TAXON_ID=36898 /ORGANISM="Pyramimonas sp., Strain CCMP2087" /LENGTH=206 /DNA_ID=CAMNT_0043899895 /DNA_START=37 /DNA_END=654 /DNA_ORIENTATION=-